MRIAVVGSGISGLSAAWLLASAHDVTLFEAEDYLGGHSNTVDAPSLCGGVVPVDTGFIVYNPPSYPNLTALLNYLGAPSAPANMSFAVSLDDGAYEYAGTSLGALFGQPSNLLRLSHWQMIRDTLRFFREAKLTLEEKCDDTQTLRQYLDANRYSDAFVERHILPMAAAIWSTPSADVMDFPIASFVRFFDNHGLLQVRDRPEWRTVRGGSREYVERMLNIFAGDVEIGNKVKRIFRRSDGVVIEHAKGKSVFDACVVATHADDTLRLLDDADAAERRLLGAFRYAPNVAVLHRDASFMPRRRRIWSSWNYFASRQGSHRTLSVTYWMNNLQPLPPDSGDFFVTLNPLKAIAAGKEIARFNYAHPMLDVAAMAARRDLWSLQGRRRTWFCGSYFGYGFHEDGLQAGLAVAEDIGGVRRPWTVPCESGRIHITGRSTASSLGEAAQ